MKRLFYIFTLMLACMTFTSCGAAAVAHSTSVDIYYDDARWSSCEIVWVGNWAYWYANGDLIPYHHNHIITHPYNCTIIRRPYRPVLHHNHFYPHKQYHYKHQYDHRDIHRHDIRNHNHDVHRHDNDHGHHNTQHNNHNANHNTQHNNHNVNRNVQHNIQRPSTGNSHHSHLNNSGNTIQHNTNRSSGGSHSSRSGRR